MPADPKLAHVASDLAAEAPLIACRFDPTGKFLRKWPVPEWGQPYGFEDLTIEPASGRLFASSAKMDSILIFDLKGNRIGVLKANPPERLEGTGSILFSQKKLYVLSTYGNRVIQITP